MKIQYKYISSLIILTALSVMAACNPFAPKLEDRQADFEGLGDQKTVEGVFQNLRYAYTYKDTVIYGRLLADDFVFSYTHEEKDEKRPVSWDRDVEMITTYNLFQAAQNLDLIWNNILTSTEGTSGDTVIVDITRGFSLNIIFPPAEIFDFQGKAGFRLRKNSPDDVWRIVSWIDLTNG